VISFPSTPENNLKKKLISFLLKIQNADNFLLHVDYFPGTRPSLLCNIKETQAGWVGKFRANFNQATWKLH
jgi:hypothetical protein